MSLYLTVKRFGASARVLRLRAFATAVGPDLSGILCAGDTNAPYFTVFRHHDAYFVRIEVRGVRLNGNAAERHATFQLLGGESITIDDYAIVMNRTSMRAEQMPGAREFLIAETTIAGLLQRIIVGEEFTVGSSPHASLYVPLPGILPVHARCRHAGNGIEVDAPADAVIAGGSAVTKNTILPLPAEFKLHPAGLPIAVRAADLPARHDFICESAAY